MNYYELFTEYIAHPNNIDFSFNHTFFQDTYTLLYDILERSEIKRINFDNISEQLHQIASDYNLKCAEIRSEKNALEKSKKRVLEEFLNIYPQFYLFIQNANSNADIELKCTSMLLKSDINLSNFIEAKQILNTLYSSRWTRNKTEFERQGGHPIVGTISERMINMIFNSVIDEQNFFRVSTDAVKSYGDFVLMCLPNNLWLSVKSSFGRERLLASGFSTDLIGVGFFSDITDFKTLTKVRNYKKVGFLVIYLPDIPMTPEQIENSENTYDQLMLHYGENQPLNINQKPFFRKLSSLYDDLMILLEKPLKDRHIIDF